MITGVMNPHFIIYKRMGKAEEYNGKRDRRAEVVEKLAIEPIKKEKKDEL